MSGGMIGISLPWEECLALAETNGFDAIDIPLDLTMSASGYREALEKHGLKPGGTGVPVDFRNDNEAFESGLATLDAKAKLAADVGCTRFATWILPASDELPFDENYRIHADRLGTIAKVLAGHGCRLGLEFVGPRTSRINKQYEFLYDLPGMMGLCKDVGANAGLLLDSWHWYTSHATVDDLLALRDDDIVYVHVNDAPAGIDVDEQIDNVRELPGATGVIDMAAFMTAMRKIGYTGPLTPEPFVKELADMPPDEVARVVGESMTKIWSE